ncbi:putative Dnase [Escherichia coli O157:H7 str. EDL933]|nr:putative Dnase [Escherichia coli O157:H7 str. EDL933]
MRLALRLGRTLSELRHSLSASEAMRKNSRFRAVNMLTGCPGIFAVFIFIIQFVVRKKC